MFNLDITRSIEEIQLDELNGLLKLDVKTIETVINVKILGQILSDDGLDKQHVKKRQQATLH